MWYQDLESLHRFLNSGPIYFLIFKYFFIQEARSRHKAPIHWLDPKGLQQLSLEQVEGRTQELNSASQHGWWNPNFLVRYYRFPRVCMIRKLESGTKLENKVRPCDVGCGTLNR